jgi:serine/threonine-protein kinase HipA
MRMMSDAFVYIDLENTQHLVGRLWVRNKNGRESASFEYDPAWLENPERFALEPLLPPTKGQFHTAQGKAMFGSIGDSSPDRWGRIIMRRAMRRNAKAEGRAEHTLFELDFLLGVNDEARQGALRFTTEKGGGFLAQEGEQTIPPLVDLPRLLSASDRLLKDDETDEDMRLLLAPGSSLGGARPKASVRDNNGDLHLAKFPRHDDEYSVVLWEGVALKLAQDAGIEVPQWRIENIADKNVILLSRFDRQKENRIPFLSAMSMIDARDNETRSYLELADALTQYGAAPSDDKAALWRRIVFQILISSTDDHMRNHAFLYGGQSGWRLSPAYDLNPVPIDVKPRILTSTIDRDDATASLDLVLSVHEEFGLIEADALQIISEVGNAVSNWRKIASQLGIQNAEIGRMSSAFEHADLEQALGS